METGLDSRPAGDRCSLAPGGVQVVLDVALAASESRRKKMREQRIAQINLSHGRRESHLGRATDSWRVEDVGLRYFGADGVALDEESAQES